MSEKPNAKLEIVEVAQRLARACDDKGVDYSIGGQIALGYWAQPRGTLDVDITIYLPSDQPTRCVRLLQSIGCELNSAEAIDSLCAARLLSGRVWPTPRRRFFANGCILRTGKVAS